MPQMKHKKIRRANIRIEIKIRINIQYHLSTIKDTIPKIVKDGANS